MIEQYDSTYEVAISQPFESQSIEISGDSRFNLLNFQSAKIDHVSPVSEESKMRFQALVLNLDDFGGPLSISGAEFTDNVFRFQSCLFDDEDVLYNDLEV